MIFFDKTRTIGQDANGKNVVWASIYVDTAANLPAYNAYQTDGFILCMASEGRCIDTGDLYRLDSAGAWQISQAGTGTYTKAEIDALLNAKQDVLTFDATPTQNSTNPVTSGGIWTDQQRQDTLQDEDRAALVELVDGGAKNLVNAPSGSNIRFINIPIVLQPGDYYVLFQNVSSTDTDAATCQFGAFAADDSQASNYPQLSRGNYTASMFTVTKQTAYVRIYASNNYASGANDTVTFTGCMICTKAAWGMSHEYQPYRPSWQKMYDMILALQ